VSAGLVQAVVHALEDHGALPIGRLAELLDVPVAEVRAQLSAFNDVDTTDAPLDPMFMITPAGGWPEEDGVPDPAPADTDIVAFSPAVAGPDLGLAHVDAGTLGPLLAAADQLSTLEPGNLPLASAVDTLRSALLAGVTGHAAYRTRTAAVFQHAATTKRAVRITYASVWTAKVATRTIHPYRVVSTRRGYEIDAGPLDDQGRPRTFLITGIRDHQLLDETFDVPAEAAAATEANRTLTPVTGVAPHRAMWAVRHWAERVDQAGSDADDVAFTAWLLPPVAQRVALICLAGGPGIDIDDPTLAAATTQMATELLHHHGL
jgi:proteasome accessory factor C